jgi:L-threonylcarbamoyladenylate synthase
MVNHASLSPTTASDAIDLAVEAWRAGHLVAFPTETVYGLGADAQNPEAVAKIFALKNRPPTHPLIVHVADLAQVAKLGITLSEKARILAETFWPGPLTLIVPRPDSLPDCVTGGRATVGIRIPKHVMAKALLRAFDGPIAAPSANRFGQLSPTHVEHVRDSFDETILPCVVDGGPCHFGLESTIVDASQPDRMILLRPGSITLQQLETTLDGYPIEAPHWSIDTDQSQRAPSPGTLARHYCPRTPLYLIPAENWTAHLQTLSKQYPDVACLGLSQPPKGLPQSVVYRHAPNEPLAYGAGLYNALHQLDKASPSLILVENPPHTMAWNAIHDRLNRATAGKLPLA